MEDIILASTSPRRHQLLELLNIPFTILTNEVEETVDSSLSPADVVLTLAERKAKAVALHTTGKTVIGADTIVAMGNRILGKPTDADDAISMLSALSGETHQVYTGVAILNGQACSLFYEKTDVTFWDLTVAEITDYVLTGEPLDKAGAYGIQGYGAILVKQIKGDYYTVVGLPVSRLKREMERLGLFE